MDKETIDQLNTVIMRHAVASENHPNSPAVMDLEVEWLQILRDESAKQEGLE